MEITRQTNRDNKKKRQLKHELPLLLFVFHPFLPFSANIQQWTFGAIGVFGTAMVTAEKYHSVMGLAPFLFWNLSH